jgi:hypothetical protein
VCLAFSHIIAIRTAEHLQIFRDIVLADVKFRVSISLTRVSDSWIHNTAILVQICYILSRKWQLSSFLFCLRTLFLQIASDMFPETDKCWQHCLCHVLKLHCRCIIVMSALMFSLQDNESPFISQEVNMRISFLFCFLKELLFL